MKKFWKWKNRMVTNQEIRCRRRNGAVSQRHHRRGSWFDDDITPQLFKDELMSGSGDITVWITLPAVTVWLPPKSTICSWTTREM